MTMPLNVYRANFNASVTTAKKTLLQLSTSSSVPLQLRKFSVKSALTTATNQQIEVVHFGTAASSMTSGTVIKVNPLSPSAATTVGTWVATQTDGTTPTVLWEDEIDLRAGAGYVELPIPEGRDVIGVSSNIALYLPAVLAGTTVLSVQIEWAE